MQPPGPPRTVAVGTATAGVLLLAAAPGPTTAWSTLRDGSATAGSAAAAMDPLVALLALAAWTLTAWLAATVALTAGGHLPGHAGRALAVVARRVAPAAVRRGVEMALGLSVVVGGLASPATATATTTTSATTTDTATSTTPGTPSLDWTTAGPDSADLSAATPPELDWSAAPTTTEAATGGPVVVRPGDTLWGLAEQQLRARNGVAPSEAEIASVWPSWWSANREAVGDDPHLLRPGTPLADPDALPAAR